MTNSTPTELAEEIKRNVGQYASDIREGNTGTAINVLTILLADLDRLRDLAAAARVPTDAMVQELGTRLARTHAVYLTRESTRALVLAMLSAAPPSGGSGEKEKAE